jgi:desampylase
MWVMGLKLSRHLRQVLLDWAEAAGERECCGLLIGQGNDATEVVLAQNVAPDPTQHFEIDPAALIVAEKHARQGGPQILGYFHSHPNGRAGPSPDDAACAADDGRYWVIIANGAITAWRPIAGVAGQPVNFHAEGPV